MFWVIFMQEFYILQGLKLDLNVTPYIPTIFAV